MPTSREEADKIYSIINEYLEPKASAELTKRFPHTMITGDALTVTNKNILQKAIEKNSCNFAL